MFYLLRINSFISPKFRLTVYQSDKNNQSSSPRFFKCGNLNDAADHCVVPCVERVGGGDAAALHPAGAALRKRETRCIFSHVHARQAVSQFWRKGKCYTLQNALEIRFFRVLSEVKERLFSILKSKIQCLPI